METDNFMKRTLSNREVNERVNDMADKYVPNYGCAETVGGEILRAIQRIIYRFYNDGDRVGIGYGCETCNSSDMYLADNLSWEVYSSLNETTRLTNSQYEQILYLSAEHIILYLDNHPELFETKNNTDSRNYFG